MRKQFAVLGLGSFGRSVALTLENMGCDVIVVDKSQETIQEISDRVTYAITADITEKEALSALGTRNLDGAIIGVAENLEAGIMATLLCKEIGIPMVVAKAKNKLQGTILKKVGADTVVYPEIEMGSRVAKSLLATEFTDWIELSNDYSNFCLERKQRYGMLWEKNYIRNYKSRDDNHTCDICLLAVWSYGDDSD